MPNSVKENNFKLQSSPILNKNIKRIKSNILPKRDEYVFLFFYSS